MDQPVLDIGKTPAAAGYAMPAEWQEHQCTWLSWPHKKESWPGKFEPVEPVMARFVGAVSKGEVVRINVLDAAHEQHVQTLLEGHADPAAIRFHRFRTNDAWCRDHGALFVCRDSTEDPLLALNFEFNAWGGKYPPYDADNAIPLQMAAALDVPVLSHPMVLEGGSIDVNGAGALLTTEQCLLHPNRNPSMSREDIEHSLAEMLGIRQVIWLGDGIVGDDTDGHVDDLTRFVAADTVVTVIEDDPHDENYRPLAENRERLAAVRLLDGRALNVIELAMPRAVEFGGDRLPASPANFYIGNRSVIVPTFDDPADAGNLQKIAACFPHREVVGIDCRDLVLGLGTFHCLTQQVPAARPGFTNESSLPRQRP